MTAIPRPLLPDATQAQTRAILGAMRAVAETGGPPSDADRMACAGPAGMNPVDPASTIATERLLLRRFRLDDAEPLHAIFADRDAMRFWSTLPHTTLAETAEFVRRTMTAQEAGTADEFVVLRDGQIVGKAGLWRANELGFIFAPRVWGRGVASEALRALMARSVRRGFVVLRADVDPRNARSRHLLQHLGFLETGGASRTLRVGGEWVDSVYLEATLARTAPHS